eukprot:6180639-Pleurochrysis_carterae.AAC.2
MRGRDRQFVHTGYDASHAPAKAGTIGVVKPRVAYSKESMKVTTHRAEAWIETSERKRSEAKAEMRRSPPSCGERACMMPAVSVAARKTTLVTSDTTGPGMQ